VIRRWTLACVVILAVASGQIGRAQTPRRAREFFSPDVAAATSRTAAPNRLTLRSRTARLAVELLREDALTLNLFDGFTIEAHRTVLRGARGTNVWHGTIADEPLGAITFVQANGIVQGSIRTAKGTFSVEPLGRGPEHVIRQVDPRLLPPESPPLLPPSTGERGAEPAHLAGALPPDPETLDLLVVYTPAARLQAGGDDDAVKARIALGVAETNLAYANSGVPHRLRLVGSELVGYQEGPDLSDDLRRLTAVADGVMDIIHARRAATGADLVMLVVGSESPTTCGVAWLMSNLTVGFAPYAFSVVAYPCISPNYSFGHELAHNMGSAHAPEDPNTPPVFPYSYGYKDPAEGFRTVMAYDCPGGCPRILYFSTPSATHDGKPIGTSGQQDNALSITETGPTVARFQTSRAEGERLSGPRSIGLDSDGRQVTLTWSRPEHGTPFGYVIEVGSAVGFSDIANIVVNDAAITSYVEPEVAPGTYFIRVRAFDVAGPSEPSPGLSMQMTSLGRCVAPVRAPELLTAAVAGSSLTFSWRAPVNAPVEGYLLGAGTRPGTVNLGVIQTSAAATTFTTSAPAGVYFVRLAGLNGCGVGAPSNEVAVVVGPSIPGPPVHLMAASVPDGRVTLSWEPPPAGGVPTRYIVEAGSAAGLADLAMLPTSGPERSLTVQAPPGRYFVRVRAVNLHGSGASSEEIVVEVQ
jgi:hypothetical protein